MAQPGCLLGNKRRWRGFGPSGVATSPCDNLSCTSANAQRSNSGALRCCLSSPSHGSVAEVSPLSKASRLRRLLPSRHPGCAIAIAHRSNDGASRYCFPFPPCHRHRSPIQRRCPAILLSCPRCAIVQRHRSIDGALRCCLPLPFLFLSSSPSSRIRRSSKQKGQPKNGNHVFGSRSRPNVAP
jgi:hypothetical protein